MNGIQHTIREYETSCALLERRIQELNLQIDGRTSVESAETKELCRRRHLLYLELAQMQFCLRELSEYLDCCGSAARTGYSSPSSSGIASA